MNTAAGPRSRDGRPVTRGPVISREGLAFDKAVAVLVRRVCILTQLISTGRASVIKSGLMAIMQAATRLLGHWS